MSLVVGCSKCGKKYKVGDDKAGKKIKCAGCGAIIAIPAAAEGEVDVWDLPPAEDSSAPPLPPLPPRGGSKKTGAKKPSKKPSGSSGLKIVLIIFGVLGGITLLGCGGCYLTGVLFLNKAKEAVKEVAKDSSQAKTHEGGTSGRPTDMDKATPVATLQSGALDRIAVREYADKVVEFQGTCSGFRGQPGSWILCLEKPNHDTKHLHAGCQGFLLKDSSVAWTKVIPGQQVTVRGYRDPNEQKHILIDCVVVKSEGPGCLRLTAQELGDETDRLTSDEFEKKYPSQMALISGTLDNIQPDQQSKGFLYNVFFKEQGKSTPIYLSMPRTADTCDSIDNPKAPDFDPSNFKAGEKFIGYGGMGRNYGSGIYMTNPKLIRLEVAGKPDEKRLPALRAAPPKSGADAEPAQSLDLTSLKKEEYLDYVFDKYLNQVLEVKGKCLGLRGGPGEWAISIGQGPGDSSVGHYLLQNPTDAFTKILPGQTVTIRGYRAKVRDALRLRGCVLTKAEGTPCEQITADDFAKKQKSLSDADFTKQYEDKRFILSGSIASVKREDGLLSIFLNAQGSSPLTLAVPDQDTAVDSDRKVGIDPATLKQGMQLKVFGRWYGSYFQAENLASAQ